MNTTQSDAVKGIRAAFGTRRCMVSERPALCGWVEAKANGETWLVSPSGEIVKTS